MASNMSSAQEIEAFKQEWNNKWRSSIGTGSQGTTERKVEEKRRRSGEPTTSHTSPPARPSTSKTRGVDVAGTRWDIGNTADRSTGSSSKTEQDDTSTEFSSGRLTDTLPRNDLLCQLFGGHRYQWISHKMNIRHPWQLKKSKSWGPFWSYQLNSTANPAHLPQNWAKLAKSAGLFTC